MRDSGSERWTAAAPADYRRYGPLVEAFLPAVRLKPFDLWINFRAYYRVAVVNRDTRGRRPGLVRVAVHYAWDAPTLGNIRRARPGWSSASVERWHDRFGRHEDEWGPGDIELVALTLRRLTGNGDPATLDPAQFDAEEMEYRTGAHIKGVLEQAWRGEWDKLGNRRVRYRVAEEPFEMMGRRAVLTIDSYHHSFYEPGEAPPETRFWPAVVPPSSRLTDKVCREFRIVENHRSYEDWEIAGSQ